MKDRLMFYFYGSSICNILLVIFLCSCAITKTATVDIYALCEAETHCVSYKEGRNAYIRGSSGERGAWQISTMALSDFNRYNKEGLLFVEEDLYTFEVSEMVANFYVSRIKDMITKLCGKEYITERNILIAWNWGIGNLQKHIKDPEGYPVPFMVEDFVKKYFKNKE